MLTNSYSDALPKWFDAGFAFECIIIAPLALVSLIVTVKTIKTFTCNN
jgi:hypothetical protein